MWPFIGLNDACVCWELSYWYAIEFSLIMRHNSCTTQSAEIFESTYMLKPDELLPIPARSSCTPRLSHPSSCLADVGIGARSVECSFVRARGVCGPGREGVRGGEMRPSQVSCPSSLPHALSQLSSLTPTRTHFSQLCRCALFVEG